jgi:hypothetical protein
VALIMGRYAPRIILSARSPWKPVVEHDYANGEERQSHCLNSPTQSGAVLCAAARKAAPDWPKAPKGDSVQPGS